MFKELVESIGSLARKAGGPSILQTRHNSIDFLVDGTLNSLPVAPVPRDHKVGSLDQLIRVVSAYTAERMPADDTEAAAIAALKVRPDSVVWYNQDAVVFVFDDDGHRVNQATLDLDESTIFNKLRSIDEHQAEFDHKGFMRLLRVSLAGTLEPTILLDKVRVLKWENNRVAESELTRTKESIGRSLKSQLNVELPDTVTLKVPVFKTMGEEGVYPLRCAVEVNHDTERLQLLPLADEIDRVMQLAMRSIGARLGEGLPDSVPCFYGEP